MSELKFLKGLEQNLPNTYSTDSSTFYVCTDSGKLILGDNVWKANLTIDSVILSSARTDSNYVLYMNGNEIFSVPIMMWDFDYNLQGCTLSDNSNEIEHGTNYSATIIPDGDDFEFKSCSIIVGGIDKTTSCFNPVTNEITINNVKSNVNIKVEYEEVTDAVGRITDNELYLFEDMLPSGTYTLYYEDENNNRLESFGPITDEATI